MSSFLRNQKTYNIQKAIIRKAIIQTGKVIGNIKLDVIFPVNKIPDNKFSANILNIMTRINDQRMQPPENIRRSVSDRESTELISSSSSNIDSNTVFLIIDILNTLKDMFFVGSIDSFTDALLNIAEKVVKNVLLEIVRMAQNYFLEVTTCLQKKFCIIPFESFLWKLFTVVQQLCCQNEEVTVEFLISNAKKIFESLQNFYSIQNAVEEKKCGTCGGYYEIAISNI